MRTLLVVTVLLTALAGGRAARGGETPPEGPPWVRDWVEAKRAALEGGRPIFVYFTKSYCPHCVPVEEDVLPSEDLAPYHERVVWVYACRNWRGDELDLLAARSHDRFGVTSWPHLVVIDPRDDAVLAEVGRSVGALPDQRDRPADALQHQST